MKTKANPQKPSNMTEVFVREPKPENVTEKIPQTINHDDTKHVLTSSIIKDEKMKGIMDKFDSVVSSNMIRKQKIDEVNEHIESEQSDIQSYLELVSQREEAIEALNRKKSSIESQYKEVETLIHTKLEPPGSTPKVKHVIQDLDDEDDDLMDDVVTSRSNSSDDDDDDDSSDDIDSGDDFDGDDF